MTTTPAPSTNDFPAFYAVAETTAKNAQNLFKRLTAARLLALVGASAIGVWTLLGTAADVFAALGGLLFLGALVIELYLSRLQPERTWYEARAAAESAKTLTWRYAVGGEPFVIGAGEDPDTLLHEQLKTVLEILKNLDLEPDIGSGQAVTDWMRRLRSSSLDSRKDAYERHRVRDQQTWYASRANDHRRDLDRWTRYLFIAEILGVVGAGIQIMGISSVNLLGLAGAAAAAVAAWMQTAQYRALHSAYAVTALDLTGVREKVHSHSTERKWSQFVEEAEKAFSREHTLWKASRGIQSL